MREWEGERRDKRREGWEGGERRGKGGEMRWETGGVGRNSRKKEDG